MMESTMKFFNIERAKNTNGTQPKKTVHAAASQWLKAYFSLVNCTMAMK